VPLSHILETHYACNAPDHPHIASTRPHESSKWTATCLSKQHFETSIPAKWLYGSRQPSRKAVFMRFGQRPGEG
jgi:hypothetical protein